MRKPTWFIVIAALLILPGLSLAGEEPAIVSNAPPQTAWSNNIFDPDAPEPYWQQEENPVRSMQSRFWGSAEYLMWWPKNGSAPSIVSGATPLPTLVDSTTPFPTRSGFIGFLALGTTQGTLNLNTTSLAAGNSVAGLQSGGRFTLGYWIDPTQRFGIEGGYFFLGMGHDSGVASNGSPALAIPFIDANTGQPSSYTVAQESTTSSFMRFVNTTPGTFVHLLTTTETSSATGSATVHSSGGLQAFDANGIFNVVNDRYWRLNLLLGFRCVELDENMSLSSSVTSTQNISTVFEPALGLPINGQPVLNNSVTTTNRTDQFNTRNTFYGGQVGAQGEYHYDRLSLFVGAQVGLGNMAEVVDIN